MLTEKKSLKINIAFELIAPLLRTAYQKLKHLNKTVPINCFILRSKIILSTELFLSGKSF